jgi:DNA-binding NtrC family response regulator
MTIQKRILVVSRDMMALQTRKLMLGAYFDVSAAGRVLEAKLHLANRDFDLIVLCYTLSDDDRHKIMEIVRDVCPRAKFLLMTATGDRSRESIHPQLSAEAGPLVLVRKAAEMLGYEFISKGRMVRAAQPGLTAVA